MKKLLNNRNKAILSTILVMLPLLLFITFTTFSFLYLDKKLGITSKDPDIEFNKPKLNKNNKTLFNSEGSV